MALPTRYTLLSYILLLLIAVGSLTACTSKQTEEEYTANLKRSLSIRNEIMDKFDDNKLSSVADYVNAADRIGASVKALDSEPPPDRYVRAHNKYVEAMQGFDSLLRRRGRCEQLEQVAAQDARACRQSIKQAVYDSLRNDFRESDTIYRGAGLSLNELREDDKDIGGTIENGDVLDGK